MCVPYALRVPAVAYWTLRRQTAAGRLANSFNLNETDITNLLVDVKTRVAGGELLEEASHAAACSWILANEDVWASWLETPTDTFLPMYLGVGGFVFVVIWFFFVEPVPFAQHTIRHMHTGGAVAQRHVSARTTVLSYTICVPPSRRIASVAPTPRRRRQHAR